MLTYAQAFARSRMHLYTLYAHELQVLLLNEHICTTRSEQNTTCFVSPPFLLLRVLPSLSSASFLLVLLFSSLLEEEERRGGEERRRTKRKRRRKGISAPVAVSSSSSRYCSLKSILAYKSLLQLLNDMSVRRPAENAVLRPYQLPFLKGFFAKSLLKQAF